MIGNVNVVDDDVTKRGMAIAVEFLDKIDANEPAILEPGAEPWMRAFALNASVSQMLFCANADRYPRDPAAQLSAVTGLASGLVQALYQIIGDRAPEVLGEALEKGLHEGWERCRALYAAKGNA
jgi:hypothetical protein